MSAGATLLTVEHLGVRLRGRAEPVVADVSLQVVAGETTALVGASGSGKSVSALALLGLLSSAWESPTGSARLHDASGGRPVDLLRMPERLLRSVRGRRVAMVFQDPGAALNPVMGIGAQIAETLRIHQRLSRKTAWRQMLALLTRVGIPDAEHSAGAFAHQFSGGMQQRAMIAMALACRPAVLIADEPTSALDLTIQAQVLTLLRALQAESAMGLLLITHDMGVTAEMADAVCVIDAGRTVEHGAAADVFARPQHAVTKRLMSAVALREDVRG